MSDQQLERLNTLLQRVQANRRTAPVRTALPANAQVLQPSAAASFAQPAAEPPRPRRSTPPLAPNAPIANDSMTAAIPADAPLPPGRRPVAPARPSPLEMAFAGELDREPAPAPAPRSQRPPAPAQPVATSMPAAPAAPLAPQEIVPRVIEPDMPRTSARAIAQVVSKHAPAIDATFGAMLKRSLSLRPH
jgi:hypothetical protein